MKLVDIHFPESVIALAAWDIAERYQTSVLLNHSIRSYIWACAIGQLRRIEFDSELLYVSALLHDIALTGAFDNVTRPFEEAAGDVAWVLGAGAGWPTSLRSRSAEIMTRHMWDEVDVMEDPEGHLLCASTSLDISGKDLGTISAAFRLEVATRHPRLGLRGEFINCLQSQASRKPESAAAAAIKGGIAHRMASNPLEALR